MNEDYEEKNLESVGLPVPLGNHCGRRLVVVFADEQSLERQVHRGYFRSDGIHEGGGCEGKLCGVLAQSSLEEEGEQDKTLHGRQRPLPMVIYRGD